MFKWVILSLFLFFCISGELCASEYSPVLEDCIDTFLSNQRRNAKIDEVEVGVYHLESGVIAYTGSQKVVPVAGLWKIYMMSAVLSLVDEGSISLEDKIVLMNGDRAFDGVLSSCADGEEFSVMDCMEIMLNQDDETAAQMLWRHCGDRICRDFLLKKQYTQTDVHISPRVLSLLALRHYSGFGPLSLDGFARKWGRTNFAGRLSIGRQVLLENEDLPYATFLREEKLSLVERCGANYYEHGKFVGALDNRTTIRELTRFLRELYRGELLSAESTKFALSLLKKNRGLEAYLPENTSIWQLQADTCGIVNALAVVEVSSNSHFVITIMMNRVSDCKMQDAKNLSLGLTREVYDFFEGVSWKDT